MCPIEAKWCSQKKSYPALLFRYIGGYWMYELSDDAKLLRRHDATKVLVASLVFVLILGSLAVLIGIPLASNVPAHISYTAHGPISINGNGGFTNGSGVVWGSGTASDPYIIEGWEINSTGFLIGIYIVNTTADFVIRDCMVHDAVQLEMLLENVTNGRLLRDECTSTQDGYGIYLAGSNHCLIENINSSANSYDGLYLSSSDNNTIRNSTFSDSVLGNGILLAVSDGNSLENNTCLRNENYGICLTSSDTNSNVNNTCSSNYYGIVLSSSGTNSIVNNTCSSNYYGLYLDSSSSNTLSNNTCSNNQFGIELYSTCTSNTLSNNTCLNNTYVGILISYSTVNVVSNNICLNNENGIYLYYTTHNTLSNNICSNNTDSGIFLEASSNYNTISNNTCSIEYQGIFIGDFTCYNILSFNKCLFDGFGIYLSSYSDHNTADNNTCTDNSYGIYLKESNSITLNSNNCSSNIGPGIYLSNSDVNVISNNNCSNNTGSGIHLSNSFSNTILNNICLDNMNNGINVGGSSNVVTNNTCFGNYNKGIYIGYSRNEKISYNNCSNNDYGIYLIQSFDSTLLNNTCIGNANDGICLDDTSYNNIISDNTCSNNGSGIRLILGSFDNTVSNNLCTDNMIDGICLDSSTYNAITNNNCSSNGLDGIYLGTSSNDNILSDNICSDNRYSMNIISGSRNIVWNNTFSWNNGAGGVYNSSHIQASDSGTNNNWNSTDGYGNYWLDWMNPDYNFDGIVDNPYILSGSSGAKDYYPLKATSRSVHCPISINNNAEFNNTLYPSNGVVSGNGSSSNPYIIEGWEINSTGFSSGIYVGNTTLRFIIQYCKIFSADKDNIEFYNLTGGTIMRVSCSLAQNGSGILIDSSNNCTIDAVYCWSNSLHGLYLNGSMDNLIRNSTFSNLHTGVGAGISLYSCSFNIIQNVICTGFHDGIAVEYSSSITVDDARVSNNILHGILLNYADYNVIRDCNASNNGGEGIYVRYSSYNLIYRNTLMNNIYHGVSISFGWPDPTQNRVWNNTFICNNGAIMDVYNPAHNQAQDNGVANVWNIVGSSNGYGNMWGDMRGPDSNHDGIVDVPYYIPGGAGSQDNYPLALWVPPPSTIAPIIINNNSEFASMAASEGWPGDGTMGDPYIINGYNIDASGYPAAIYIGNTTVYFVISSCTLSNTLSAGNVSDAAVGIVLYNVIRGRLANNNCSSDLIGIDLEYSNDNTIENNICEGNFYGITLMTSSDNVIINNNCQFNDGFGIFLLSSSDNNLLVNNICNSNNGSGISLYSMCNNNVIDNNTCSFSAILDGISIGFSCNDNLITGNNCSSNYFFGIDLLYASNRNTISGNQLCDNQGYGVAIASANDTGNRIQGNTFIGNNGAGAVYDASHAQAYDGGMDNWWNSSTGYGNYWSDWTAPDDVAPFGIVDVSYEISGGAFSTDCYPLTAFPGSPDVYAPMTASSLSGTLGTNGWYRSSVTMTLSASDWGSGISATYYRIGGTAGDWTAYSSQTQLSTESNTTVQFYSIDNAGNYEVVVSIEVLIDTVNPVTTATVSGSILSLSTVDDTSGVYQICYRIDGGAWMNYTEPVTIVGTGHSVEYYSVDKAGNSESIKSIDIGNAGFLGINLLSWVLIIIAATAAVICVLIIVAKRRSGKEPRDMIQPTSIGYPPQQVPQMPAQTATIQQPISQPQSPMAVIPCPYCGSPNSAGWLFCGSCGAKLR
jgi:parallel beta-helix repeat protein